MAAQKRFGFDMMRRPFGLGAQPTGSTEVTNEAGNMREKRAQGYWCTVWYDRALTVTELHGFEMQPHGVDRARTMAQAAVIVDAWGVRRNVASWDDTHNGWHLIGGGFESDYDNVQVLQCSI